MEPTTAQVAAQAAAQTATDGLSITKQTGIFAIMLGLVESLKLYLKRRKGQSEKVKETQPQPKNNQVVRNSELCTTLLEHEKECWDKIREELAAVKKESSDAVNNLRKEFTDAMDRMETKFTETTIRTETKIMSSLVKLHERFDSILLSRKGH